LFDAGHRPKVPEIADFDLSQLLINTLFMMPAPKLNAKTEELNASS
jgi:hypothetical protein